MPTCEASQKETRAAQNTITLPCQEGLVSSPRGHRSTERRVRSTRELLQKPPTGARSGFWVLRSGVDPMVKPRGDATASSALPPKQTQTSTAPALLLGALLFCSPGFALAQGWEDPLATYNKAQEALAQGDIPTAKATLEALKARGFTPSGFWLLYGIALFGTQDLVGAKEAFLRASAEAPSDGQAFFYLGLIALSQENPQEAKERLTQAKALLPPEGELFTATEKLLSALPKDAPKKPKRLSSSIEVATQADSNALLTSEGQASEEAGARVLIQVFEGFRQPLSESLSLQVAAGFVGAFPFVNAEALAPIDPSGGVAALSFEVQPKASSFFLGVSAFGKLLRRDFFQEAFLQEVGAAAITQIGQKLPVRLTYRIYADDFVISENVEETSFDQDNLTQEAALSVATTFGLSAALLYAQAEADGNSFDRRSGDVQLGFEKNFKRLSLKALGDAALVDFPNGFSRRQDTRLSGLLRASVPLGSFDASLSYLGLFNRSDDEQFSYDRHLFTLGVQWRVR